jgi:outer membrane biosynthesis protein TonB
MGALEALKDWRFEPATLDGKPVAVAFALTVNYEP